MKKVLSLVLAVMMLLGCLAIFASCGETTGSGSNETKAPSQETTGKSEETTAADPNKYENVKVGFIFLHDDKSTYDLNFMNGVAEMKANLGLSDDQVIMIDSIEEGKPCYDAAADLVDQGCNVVFADSFGHEEWMIKAAKEFPDVQFCHATGVKAHTEKLDNYHNAFASIYEGRYLAGVAAGMKLNEMIADKKITPEQAVIGYVGAFPYAEVISGYTSFFLGARSVCESATMMVDFSGSWFDVDEERNIANALIGKGCVLISQHADSMGAPSACELAGVPDVSYNGSTVAECPNTFIISSRINWAPYFEYMVNCVAEGKAIAADWTGTLATGSVVLSEINDKAAAAGTAEAIENAKKQLVDGTLHVFDTSKFTVDGQAVTSYKADVDDMGDFVGETEVIADGYFHESEYRSAPYFDMNIDGITRLDK